MLPTDVLTVIYDAAPLMTKVALSCLSRELNDYHRKYMMRAKPTSKRLENHLYTGFVVPRRILRMYTIPGISSVFIYNVENDHIDSAIELLEVYNCDERMENAIASSRDMDLLQTFIHRGTCSLERYNYTIKHFIRNVVISNNVEALQYLLQAGIASYDDMYNSETIKFAAMYNGLNTLRFLLETRPSGLVVDVSDACMYACVQGYMDCARLLLSYGADINVNNGTVLKKVGDCMSTVYLTPPIDCEFYEVVKFLLDNGADMVHSQTLTRFAAKNNYASTLALLLERGAARHTNLDYLVRFTYDVESAKILNDYIVANQH